MSVSGWNSAYALVLEAYDLNYCDQFYSTDLEGIYYTGLDHGFPNYIAWGGAWSGDDSYANGLIPQCSYWAGDLYGTWLLALNYQDNPQAP